MQPNHIHAGNPGDSGGEATPVPIPNTEVKLSSAEDTERAAFRENRSSPGFLRFQRIHLVEAEAGASRPPAVERLFQTHRHNRSFPAVPWRNAASTGARRRYPQPMTDPTGRPSSAASSVPDDPSSGVVPRPIRRISIILPIPPDRGRPSPSSVRTAIPSCRPSSSGSARRPRASSGPVAPMSAPRPRSRSPPSARSCRPRRGLSAVLRRPATIAAARSIPPSVSRSRSSSSCAFGRSTSSAPRSSRRPPPASRSPRRVRFPARHPWSSSGPSPSSRSAGSTFPPAPCRSGSPASSSWSSRSWSSGPAATAARPRPWEQRHRRDRAPSQPRQAPPSAPPSKRRRGRGVGRSHGVDRPIGNVRRDDGAGRVHRADRGRRCVAGAPRQRRRLGPPAARGPRAGPTR